MHGFRRSIGLLRSSDLGTIVSVIVSHAFQSSLHSTTDGNVVFAYFSGDNGNEKGGL